MAKKQTRRSISVSRSTYERLKAYCETNAMSMSQFVESQVGDFLGRPRRDDRVELQVPQSAPAVGEVRVQMKPSQPAPVAQAQPTQQPAQPVAAAPRPAPAPAPAPAKPNADQIFTF